MNQDEAYLSLPKKGLGAGILVLHSWWGLNDFFRDFSDRLAAQGFVVLAPDLYQGKVATSISGAKRLRAAVTASRKEPAYKFLSRMIGVLSTHELVSAPMIAVVGCSMGGHWAYWLAQRPELPIGATITFYAARNGNYSNSASSFLGHFAESDEWVSAASIRKLSRSLEKANRKFEFYTYPGTSHWFLESNRADAFDADASELAWERTIAFLVGALKLTRRSTGRTDKRHAG